MNNLELTDWIDAEEGRDSAFGCKNCGSTANLTNYWPDDSDKSITLCEDCAEEQHKVEAEADRLSNLPSCDYRLMLMDKAESVQQMVNLLRAHDMGCACTMSRKPAAIAAFVPVQVGGVA